MKLCVIGASGLMGRSLVARLADDKDLRITATSRNTPAARRPPGTEGGVQWLRADLNSPADCERVVADQDAILHLAHTHTPLTSDANMASDAALNLIPTLNLLQAIKESGRVSHLIYPSSGGSVYGETRSNDPFTEQSACVPVSSYGLQKLAAEQYIRLHAERGYLTASVLRIANAYGWFHSLDRGQGLIGNAVQRALNRMPIAIIGNPDNVRDYIHIDDVFRAFRACLTRRVGFEVFNIGTGVGSSVLEVVSVIERLTGTTAGRSLEANERTRLLVGRCVLDSGKARRELGWRYRIGLEDGIKAMLAETRGERPPGAQK